MRSFCAAAAAAEAAEIALACCEEAADAAAAVDMVGWAVITFMLLSDVPGITVPGCRCVCELRKWCKYRGRGM